VNRCRILYYMVRADFLERVRRYSFLVTLGFSIYLGYAVYAGQIVVQLDSYRGANNSAWLGSVISLVATSFLTLIGFYIVKNAIQRDRETRVGQILATTPMSKSFYTLSKALSNFAVLAAMVLILAMAALVIQLSRTEDPHIHFVALFLPLLVFGLCALAVTAALAVLCETLPGLRGGVGNVVYFFLWSALVSVGIATMEEGRSITATRYVADYTGIGTLLGQMQAQVHQIDPGYRGGASFTIGGLNPTTKTFLWNGLKWNSAIVFSRGVWLGIAAVLALLAAMFFNRFDPAHERSQAKEKKKTTTGKSEIREPFGVHPPQPRLPNSHLTPLPRTRSRTRFFLLVWAELRLIVRGHGWWWYVVAAGLFVACLASPLAAARSGVIVAAWLWPILLWSQMGTREVQFSTHALIFSAPHAFPRQLLATLTAGVVVAVLTGAGLGLHLLLARNFEGLAAWTVGALFIPALALALGICTESRKPFEALYTAWWYIGPLHHIPKLDFMGTTARSSTPGSYFAAFILLVMVAYAWRGVRMLHS